MQPNATSVGVLYVVYAQHGASNPKGGASSLAKYLAEAVASAARLRELNPRLPIGLSTTEAPSVLPKAAMAFSHVLQLAPAGKLEPLWVPRLRAIAACAKEIYFNRDT